MQNPSDDYLTVQVAYYKFGSKTKYVQKQMKLIDILSMAGLLQEEFGQVKVLVNGVDKSNQLNQSLMSLKTSDDLSISILPLDNQIEVRVNNKVNQSNKIQHFQNHVTLKDALNQAGYKPESLPGYIIHIDGIEYKGQYGESVGSLKKGIKGRGALNIDLATLVVGGRK